MGADIIIGNTVIEGEKVEQITTEILSILAENKLNYDTATYVVDTVKNKLGEKCVIKKETAPEVRVQEQSKEIVLQIDGEEIARIIS